MSFFLLYYHIKVTFYERVNPLHRLLLFTNVHLPIFLPSPGGPALHSRPENHCRALQSSWQQAQKQIHQHRGLWVVRKIWLWCLLPRNPIIFLLHVFSLLIIHTNTSIPPPRWPQPGEVTSSGGEGCQTLGLHQCQLCGCKLDQSFFFLSYSFCFDSVFVTKRGWMFLGNVCFQHESSFYNNTTFREECKFGIYF